MTHNNNGKILVLGGTGKTGRRIAERLVNDGRRIRIGSRSATPAFHWSAPNTWEQVLQGITSVYLTYSPDAGFPGAAETIGAFAAQAVDSGVDRIVLLTGRGEAGAQRGESHVRDSGADWTVVRSSFFAQNFSEDFLAEAINAGAIAFPARNVEEPFIDVEDIADVAFAALTQDGHAGRTYEVTGPRLLTFPAAVAEIAGALGFDIRYQSLSLAEFRAVMVSQGVEVEFAKNLTAVFGEVLDGRNSYVGDGVQRALGRPPRDFADYVRRGVAEGAWEPAGAGRHDLVN